MAIATASPTPAPDDRQRLVREVRQLAIAVLNSTSPLECRIAWRQDRANCFALLRRTKDADYPQPDLEWDLDYVRDLLDEVLPDPLTFAAAEVAPW